MPYSTGGRSSTGVVCGLLPQIWHLHTDDNFCHSPHVCSEGELRFDIPSGISVVGNGNQCVVMILELQTKEEVSLGP